MSLGSRLLRALGRRAVGLAVFGVVLMCWAGAAQAQLVAAGSLVASDGGEGIGSVAVSGSTVFAGAEGATIGTRLDSGAVFVFDQPAGGWSGALHESGMLASPDGVQGFGQVVVASGPVVVVPAAGILYVYVEPAGGWVGVIKPVAKLTAPGEGLGNGNQDGVAISPSGRTIVATASPSIRSLYVFTEPAGGWSGTVTDTAKLTGSDRPDLFNVAMSGRTIVAVGNDPSGLIASAYVFTEPAGGWANEPQVTKLTAPDSDGGVNGVPVISDHFIVLGGRLPSGWVGLVYAEPAGGWHGTEQESATLHSSDGSLVYPPTGISGNYVFSDSLVWKEPAGGWSGSVYPAATLTPSKGPAVFGDVVEGDTVITDSVAASGPTVVSFGLARVFTEPTGGWSGTVHQTAILQSGAQQDCGSFSCNGIFAYSEPATGWADESQPAVLSPSGNPNPIALSALAVSGRTLVAGDDAALEDGYLIDPNLTPAYVFTEPAAGWSTETQAAQLFPTGLQNSSLDIGSFGSAVAVSGQTAVVSAPGVSVAGHNFAGAAYVFTQPAGGWSGTVSQTATLTPTTSTTDGQFGSQLAMSGRTIVAGRYVFIQPPGGWSGTLHQAATLWAPSGSYGIGSTVIAGDMIAALSSRHRQAVAYVYTEPPGGWSGALTHPVARLVPSAGALEGDLATSGQYVYATGVVDQECSCRSAVFVFKRPTGGWHGIVHETARLRYRAHIYQYTSVPGPTLAVSAHRVAVLQFEDAIGSHASCPCYGAVWDFSEPVGGWSGTKFGSLRRNITNAGTTAYGLASTDDTTFIAGGGPFVSPYSIQTSP
jgi:hypothetical protein